MSEEERGFIYAAVYNLLLVAAVVAITTIGVVYLSSWNGLWSLLILLGGASHKSKSAKAKEGTGE